MAVNVRRMWMDMAFSQSLIGHYSFSFRNGDQLFGSKITFSTFKLHTINLFLFSYKLIVWLEE